MKLISNFFLTITFAVVFIVTVFSYTFRFEILDFDFWKESFDGGNTYSGLQSSISKVLDLKAVDKKKLDGSEKIFLKLATTDLIKDVLDNNLKNFLSFTNGTRSDWIIYIPTKNIPKNTLIPAGLKISENTKYEDLAKQLNFKGLEAKQLDWLSKLGYRSKSYFAVSILLMVILILTSMIIVEAGSRFVSTGIMLILSGIILRGVILLTKAVEGSISNEWIKGVEPSQLLLAPVLSPVLKNVTVMWSYSSWGVIVFGIILLFIRKPQLIIANDKTKKAL